MNKLSVKKIETQEQRQILRIQIFSQNNEISKNESEKNEEKLDLWEKHISQIWNHITQFNSRISKINIFLNGAAISWGLKLELWGK